MKHSAFAAVAALFIALTAVPAAAGDYMGWYLGAGIGYGYPMTMASGGACTGEGGKIINHKGRTFCTKPVNSKPGPADAAINTSRSNISRPSLSATGGASSGPADAPISTSRSNITRPSLSATGGASGGPADAAVNTSRSNITRPSLSATGKSKKSSQGMTVNANPNLSTH